MEKEKGLEYRSRDESTAEPLSPLPSTTRANQNGIVGMNRDSYCYCPSLLENKDRKGFKELSKIT